MSKKSSLYEVCVITDGLLKNKTEGSILLKYSVMAETEKQSFLYALSKFRDWKRYNKVIALRTKDIFAEPTVDREAVCIIKDDEEIEKILSTAKAFESDLHEFEIAVYKYHNNNLVINASHMEEAAKVSYATILQNGENPASIGAISVRNKKSEEEKLFSGSYLAQFILDVAKDKK